MQSILFLITVSLFFTAGYHEGQKSTKKAIKTEYNKCLDKAAKAEYIYEEHWGHEPLGVFQIELNHAGGYMAEIVKDCFEI